MLAAGLLAIGSICPVAQAAPDLGPPFRVGLHVNGPLTADQALRLGNGGTSIAREAFLRQSVQASPSAPYDWSIYDDYVGAAAAGGLDLLPILLDTAPTTPETYDDPQNPPTTPAELARFTTYVKAAVERYGPSGSFWAEHPEITARPVHIWQVWNEPNLRKHWDDDPNAREYARLLKLTRRAILHVDPSALIMLAGMPEHHHIAREDMTRYLAELYKVKGVAKLFDAAAVHSYTRRAKGALSSIRAVRKVMDANGDRDKPIWISEMGWASGGPDRHPTVTTLSGQAANLTDSFEELAAAANKYEIGGAIWYSWRDPVQPPDVRDRFWFHSGLFDPAGEPKPAWQAFAEFTGGSPGDGPL